MWAESGEPADYTPFVAGEPDGNGVCVHKVVLCSAPSVPHQVFTSMEKAPTRAFSWLKAPNSAFTFKTL